MADHARRDGEGWYFGHRIYLSGDWPPVARYRDTDELVPRGPSERPCPMCGQLPTPQGHDPCIASLPGVVAACCGHGVEPGYVMFETGHVIRGKFEPSGNLNCTSTQDTTKPKPIGQA